VSKVIGDNPAVDSVITTADETNNGRLFINLKPRRERETMEKVLESLRRDVRRIPGVNVYFNPIQNLRLGGRVSKSRFQYVLKSVDGGILQENADKLIALMRPDPIFRDVTSDAQLKGLQAQLDIDRDKANSLGVNIQDIRTALYSTFGERQVSTIYTAVDSYSVILQASDADRRDESAFNKIYVRSKSARLVPLSSVTTVKRTVGPIAINHAGQLQSITVSFNLAPGWLARRGRQEDRAVSPADRHAPFDPHELGRRRGRVPVVAVHAALAHPHGAPRDLRAAGRALRELHPPAHHLRGASLGRHGRAARAVDLRLRPVHHRDHRHPDAHRHREEERHHDDRLRAERAARGGHDAARRDPPGVPAALPSHHDDHLRGHVRRGADRAGLGTGAELRQPLGLAVVGGLLVSQVITLFVTPVIYLYLDRYSGKGPVTRKVAPTPVLHGASND
jgi:HAE1 family hydrophobic/amphiphilic exporter-1